MLHQGRCRVEADHPCEPFSTAVSTESYILYVDCHTCIISSASCNHHMLHVLVISDAVFDWFDGKHLRLGPMQ